MNKALLLLAGSLILVAGLARGQSLDSPDVLTDSAVATNSAPVTEITTNDTDQINSAWLYAIKVDLSGTANPTCDVDVVTIGSAGTGESRTLLSIDDITADAMYYPRDIADTTAGVDITAEPVLIPLSGDKIRVLISNSTFTGVVARTQIFLKR